MGKSLATTEYILDQLADVPTTEQVLVASARLWQGSTSGLTLTTPGHSFFPGFIAPFPVSLVQVSLTHDSSGDIPADAANFYNVSIQRMRAKTGAAIVARATSLLPWAIRTDWNMDVGTFDPTNQLFSKGDMLQVVITQTGTPAVTLSDIGITARFEPQ